VDFCCPKLIAKVPVSSIAKSVETRQTDEILIEASVLTVGQEGILT
jgi:hypothetical protein